MIANLHTPQTLNLDQRTLLTALVGKLFLVGSNPADQSKHTFVQRLTGFGYCTTITREDVPVAKSLYDVDILSECLTFEEAGLPRLSFEVSAAGALVIYETLLAKLAAPGQAGKPGKLSEAQQSLVDKLRAGAMLQHEQSGLVRLHEGTRSRSIHPATVQSLLDAGVLLKGLGGRCGLA